MRMADPLVLRDATATESVRAAQLKRTDAGLVPRGRRHASSTTRATSRGSRSAEPGQFDVVVTENMFGDIPPSDLAARDDRRAPRAGAVGESRRRRAGNLRAGHGSAPDIAGRGIANPTGMLRSTPHARARPRAAGRGCRAGPAVEGALATTPTQDLGGTATTAEFRTLRRRPGAHVSGSWIDGAEGLEQPIVSAVTHSENEVVFDLSGLPTDPGSPPRSSRRSRPRVSTSTRFSKTSCTVRQPFPSRYRPVTSTGRAALSTGCTRRSAYSRWSSSLISARSHSLAQGCAHIRALRRGCFARWRTSGSTSG